MTTNKQTDPSHFHSVRQEKKVSLQEVADTATVSTRDASLFEIGAVVSDEVKQQMIQAFSQLIEPSSLEEHPPVPIHPLGRSRGGGAQ